MKAPAFNLTMGGVLGLAAVAALGLLYMNRKALAATVGDAVNPASSNNLASKAVNGVVQAATGDPNQTLGGWIWDVVNGQAFAAKYDTNNGTSDVVSNVPTLSQAGTLDSATITRWLTQYGNDMGEPNVNGTTTATTTTGSITLPRRTIQ